MKVMIVDDHQGMRAMLRSLLPVSRFEVCECKDGAEAVETFGRFRPDWVLMDVSMKDTDGIAATRLLTAAFPDAHVVMVMDSLEVRLRNAARNAGACAFVGKENLLEVRSLLESPPGAGILQSSSPSHSSP
jgi:DNA-binding NarL/FixJ family response regulator